MIWIGFEKVRIFNLNFFFPMKFIAIYDKIRRFKIILSFFSMNSDDIRRFKMNSESRDSDEFG